MKRNTFIKYGKILIIPVITLIIYTGCNKYNDLGMNILPSSDLISVGNVVFKDDILAYTVRDDSIETDEAPKSLLGSLNDPIFGNTTINFAAQFRLPSFPDYGTNPEVDSTYLFLYYRIFYGDTVTPQHIKVYELNERIYSDYTDSTHASHNYKYYEYTDLKSMASNQLLGELEFTPKTEIDSTTLDTVYQVLRIPIDNSLANKLMSADSFTVADQQRFLDYFNGLYIESERVTDGGAIITLETVTDGTIPYAALGVYYNNDENKALSEPDTMVMSYVINQFSARINQMTHDYSGTPFAANLDKETGIDSLLYLQTTGGLKSRIYINNLVSWKDTLPALEGDTLVINKAELVFQADTVNTFIDSFPPPNRIYFLAIDSTGQGVVPKDYYFSPSYYSGYLYSDYTYRFNITQQVQDIIDGKIENRGFELITGMKNSDPKRVVLKGTTSNTGIKLVITYSRVHL